MKISAFVIENTQYISLQHHDITITVTTNNKATNGFPFAAITLAMIKLIAKLIKKHMTLS